MTPEALDLWLKIASSAVSLIALAVAFVATRRKAINDRLEAGSKRMDGYDLAIQSMQAQINNMPGKDDIHRLELMVARMSGDLREMRAGVEANHELLNRFTRIVERQEEHLLNNGGGNK